MNSLRIGFSASLLLAWPTTVAYAADVTSIPMSTTTAVAVHDQGGMDWSGFYAGFFGIAQNGALSGTQAGVGLQAGVNAQFDFYLLGAEVAVSGLAGGIGDTSYGQILGRAGLVATDNVLVYAAGGYGLDLGPPSEQDALLGGGVELAVTDSVSLRAQYLHGFALEGANSKDQFTLGANFHF